MRRSILLLAMTVVILTLYYSYATSNETPPRENSPPASDTSESYLPFLMAGEYYVIRFPASHHPFRKVSHRMTRTSTGKPASWSITYETSTFRVREHGRAGWVLLDHPKDITQSAKFGIAAMRLAHVEAADREESRRAISEIETVSTWVNLDHAIAITTSPDPTELKLDVNVTVKNGEH